MLSTLSWRKLWAKVQPIDKLVRNCTSICTYLISSDFDRHVQLYLRYFQFLSFPYSLHQSVTSKILKSSVLHSFPPYGPKQLYFTHKGSPFIKSAMSIWTLPKFHLTIPIFFSETLFFESEFCLGL